VPSHRRSPGGRRPLAVGVCAAVVLPLWVLLPTARADDEPVGDTVVGQLRQVWAEHLDPAEASAHAEDGPLSWIETDSGEAVRVPTEDVADIPVGSTVEVLLGEEVPDAAAQEQGVEPALEVLEATVVETAPAAAPPVAPAGTPTNRVTVVGVVPRGVTPSGTTAVVDTLAAVVNDTVAPFWSEQSNTTVEVEATAWSSWVELDHGCDDWFGMWDDADRAVSAFQDVVGSGDHLLLYLDDAAVNFPDCADGLGTIGADVGDGGLLYTTGLSPSIVAHELGHNFGLGHASALSCDSDMEEEAANVCQIDEYYDWYDVMGFSWNHLGTLNAPHAARLGLLPAGQQATVRVQDNVTRTYTLLPTGGRTGLRAVRLIDDDGTAYWLEYRTATARDAWLTGSGLQAGVQLRRENDGNDTSLLIDPTADGAAWGEPEASALPVGQEIYPGAGFSVTLLSQSPGGAVVRVSTRADGLAGDVRCQGWLRPQAPLSGVAFLTNAGGTAALAVATADRALWSRPVDGSASSWRSLGGSLLYGPAATVAGTTSYVFAVGTDSALWYRMHSGAGWTPWRSLGGRLAGSPAAASLGAGHVRVFGRGSDGGLWSREFTAGAWGAWVGHGGYLSSPPTATTDLAQNRIEVDLRGGDGYLYEVHLPAGVRTAPFQRKLMTVCSALAMGPTRAVTDPARGVYLDLNNVPRLLEGWGSRSFGGSFTSTPAVHFSVNDVLVAGRGSDGALWLYDGRAGRKRWVNLGGRI
jgi:hypothetical protein